MTDVAAGIAALRAGRPLQIGGQAVLSVETGTNAMLGLLDPTETAGVLLSEERARALNLTNSREGTAGPVRVSRCEWLDRDLVRALADPGRDLSRLVPGPLTIEPLQDAMIARAALTLARLAGVLPALWLLDVAESLDLEPEHILSAARGASAQIVARARLPVGGVEDTQMIAFRAPDDGSEHVALMVGAPGGKPPLVRLHSECLTGDVFGSLKCDCGPQLHEALRLIGTSGSGVLLYLRQEGRGIGLANKLRAYALQDRGLDTVEANRRLGFEDDARDYALAAAMLRALGIDEVRLLTNNPAKVAGLKAEGIAVVDRIAHHMPANPHNADYLATKRRKSGHLD